MSTAFTVPRQSRATLSGAMISMYRIDECVELWIDETLVRLTIEEARRTAERLAEYANAKPSSEQP